MRDFKTIAFATDFSDCSEAAFDYAYSLAKKCDAKLLLVHVINEPVDLRGFYVPHISYDVLEDEISEGANKMMDSFCRKNIQEGDNYAVAIVSGLDYEEIINQSTLANADLIVMGTSGRSGLDHMLFGSTAEKVVRKSPIPVLTVSSGKS
ncbi:MAG: universal stress protein [Desulfobacteraceae bacterium 4572_35.1]|nr:MAG: universal stress protein [Desulfobacteraceae bacterium 4572_35.1]